MSRKLNENPINNGLLALPLTHPSRVEYQQPLSSKNLCNEHGHGALHCFGVGASTLRHNYFGRTAKFSNTKNLGFCSGVKFILRQLKAIKWLKTIRGFFQADLCMREAFSSGFAVEDECEVESFKKRINARIYRRNIDQKF